MTDDATVPEAVEMEAALLGALLIDPGAFGRIAARVRSEDFYDIRHRVIYAAMVGLDRQGQHIDYMTLYDALDQGGRLSDAGGFVYITGLTNATPTSLHVETYAQRVAEVAVRRRLITAANSIARLGYSGTTEGVEAVREAERLLGALAAPETESGLRPIGDILPDVWAGLTEAPNPQTGRLDFGYSRLRSLLGGGFGRSDLVILAGRPGLGKTSLAIGMAHAVANRGGQVALFSLEMSDTQLVERLLKARAGLLRRHVRPNDHVSPPELERLEGALGAILDLPLYIDDTAGISVGTIRAKARTLAAQHGLDLVVVDYLQLIQGNGRNRVQEVSEVSRTLKLLAKELQVPVLALSQLSREVERRDDHKPKLADLRDSGSLEQDADVVLFIYRAEASGDDDAAETPGVVQVLVEKNRHGPRGEVSLAWTDRLSSFIDLGTQPDPGAA